MSLVLIIAYSTQNRFELSCHYADVAKRRQAACV